MLVTLLEVVYSRKVIDVIKDTQKISFANALKYFENKNLYIKLLILKIHTVFKSVPILCPQCKEEIVLSSLAEDEYKTDDKYKCPYCNKWTFYSYEGQIFTQYSEELGQHIDAQLNIVSQDVLQKLNNKKLTKDEISFVLEKE